jgi:hypothetical protein
MKKIIVINCFLFFSVRLPAQDTLSRRMDIIPVQIEALAGNERLALQTVVIKPFTVNSKFSILSFVETVNSYDNKEAQNFDLDNITQVNYDLYRGFGPSLGLTTNNLQVFAPNAGLNYILLRPILMFLVNPTVALTTGHDLSCIAILEYRPPIKKKLSLYTRLQAYYSYNLDNHYHERSFLTARLGLSYDRFTYGIGANIDRYGPTIIQKKNYGIHLMYLFL